MNTPDFTPGPWEVTGPDDEPYGDISVGVKGRRICRLWQDDAPVHDYNSAQWANARLIAAAPALLESCYIAISALMKLGQLPGGGARAKLAIDVLIAAIQKATADDPAPAEAAR